MLIGKTGSRYKVKILGPGPRRVRMPSARNLMRNLTPSSRIVMHWLLAHRQPPYCTICCGTWEQIACDCGLTLNRVRTAMHELEQAECIQRRGQGRFPLDLNPLAWDRIERYGADWEICYWEGLARWNQFAAEQRQRAMLAHLATLPDLRPEPELTAP